MESCFLNFLDYFLVKTTEIIIVIHGLGKKIILEGTYLYENENYAPKNS